MQLANDKLALFRDSKTLIRLKNGKLVKEDVEEKTGKEVIDLEEEVVKFIQIQMDYLFVALDNGHVRVYSMDQFELIQTFHFDGTLSFLAVHYVFSDFGVVLNENVINFRDAKSHREQKLHIELKDSQVTSIIVTDLKQVAYGTNLGRIYVWNSTVSSEHVFCLEGHKSSVTQLQSYKSNMASYCVEERFISIWCIETGKFLNKLRFPSDIGLLTNIFLTENSLVTTDSNDLLIAIDLVNKTEYSRFHLNLKPVQAVLSDLEDSFLMISDNGSFEKFPISSPTETCRTECWMDEQKDRISTTSTSSRTCAIL